MPGAAAIAIRAEGPLGVIEGQSRIEVSENVWRFDDDDWALFAMLCDPVYMSELLFSDPKNREYSGCYHVMDYQYGLFRWEYNYEGYPCARSVGKTESMKARAVCHVFRRQGEDMLITAPELIHLMPLCDAIEGRLRDTRLTFEFLDKRNQKTGFTHKPFQADFMDGTKIIGRIPKISGTGVKGQHVPDLLIEEAQDYPEKGWIEVHEAQPLDAPVLTPYGFARMGELESGDVVVGSGGQPVEVLDVIDHGKRVVWEVELDDGTVVECDAKHYWTVGHRAERWKVVRTEDIPDLLACGVLRLPQLGMVAYERSDALPCDPYLLGVVLGDGCVRRHALTVAVGDRELLTHLRERLDDSEEFVSSDGRGIDYRLRKVGPRSRHGRPPSRDALECAGVWGRAAHEKFIPSVYLTASRRERLDLLAGLVDTDGNVDQRGAVRFSSSSKRLADDVAALVLSLGGRLSRSEQPDHRGYRTMHCVRFRLPDGLVPCKLSRKVSRIQPCATATMFRTVVAVRKTRRLKPMRCIEVAAADGLYVTGGYALTHNTVMKDHVDSTGKADFVYHFYGVHSGARDGRFYKLSTSGEFQIRQVTALMRPGWGPDEKRRAAAIYGGTEAPDYKRNILGEAGGSSSAFFVTSRLMACLDQDRESKYNTEVYKRQNFIAEEVDKMLGLSPDTPKKEWDKGMYELLGSLLDLPDIQSQQIYFGQDVGLVNDPSVITLWAVQNDAQRKTRLKLIRMFHLWRFREKQQRQVLYHIGWKYGARIRGGGIDVTGLGLPMFQAMEDDELAPQHLLDVTKGYVFNAKLPIGIDKSLVSKDSQGNLRDQFGSMVEVQVDPFTRIERYVVMMSMIEASTRYLREFVDSTYLQLPFDVEIAGDMQGETEQRVKAMAGTSGRKKYNAFHILDSMRAMAMVYKAADVEAQLAVPDRTPIMAKAVDVGAPSGMPTR